MFFFNLSAVEFMALLSAASAVVVTLYLLNRARRKRTVATLRFWRSAERPVAIQRRKRIQQPLSLILQLVSIALLLLAIAQLRWGSPDRSSRDHVLLLDTSAWMAARVPKGTLLDEAKSAAKAYIRALPSTDRVMIVRSDALATPVTGLEENREVLDKAIDQSRPGAASLDLSLAFSFAADVQRLNAQRPGEIVFAGAGRVAEHEGSLIRPPEGPLRVLPVSEVMENCGIRQIGLRRSLADPALWQGLVTVRNYGVLDRTVPVSLAFGNVPVGGRTVVVPAGKQQEVQFEFRTKAAGWLEARLLTNDSLEEDNRAILEIPPQAAPKLVVYSDDPESLRPLFAANPQVSAVFLRPSQYDSKSDARIVLFDRFRPTTLPNASIIWIEPPRSSSPIPVQTVAQSVPIVRWRSDHVLATGLRAKQVKLESSEVFSSAAGDTSIAEVEAGPVIVARSGTRRELFIGFHPARSLKFDLTTPLLFANALRWMQPELFRNSELYAGTAGALTLPLDSDAEASQVRVTADGKQLPFTVRGRTVRLFAGLPGTIQVLTESREQVYSLTLPEVGDVPWQPPAAVLRGVPPRRAAILSRDLWPLLAMLGALGLAAEWLLFGRTKREAARVKAAAAGGDYFKKAS
jgi:hypothetical protein